MNVSFVTFVFALILTVKLTVFLIHRLLWSCLTCLQASVEVCFYIHVGSYISQLSFPSLTFSQLTYHANFLLVLGCVLKVFAFIIYGCEIGALAPLLYIPFKI